MTDLFITLIVFAIIVIICFVLIKIGSLINKLMIKFFNIDLKKKVEDLF